MYGTPIYHFIQGYLQSLVRKLKNGKINALLFERASVMSTIKRSKVPGVQYFRIGKVNASFAVRKGRKGTKLKKKINRAIKKIDKNKIFGKYMRYFRLPDKGIVSLK